MNENKTKVIHFICGIKSGGVEQVIYNYLSTANDAFEHYIVYQHEASKVCYEKLASVAKELIRVPSKSKRPFSNLIKSYKIIKKIHPDIVHCHMNQYNFFALIPAKLNGVRIRINHSHTDFSKTTIIKRFYLKICFYINKLFTNINFACGEGASKANLIKKTERCYILPNRIESEKFVFNNKYRQEIRKKYFVKEGEKLIATIGRMEKVKNQKRLVQIFKKIFSDHKNYKLMIIGNGKLKLSTKKLIDEDMINNVIFVDPVGDIYKYYSAFDVFVLTSLYEGLPVTSIEAQFNEVPLVLSDTIDKGAKISNYVSFISLDENDDTWANELIKKAENSRKIKESTEKLYSCYSLNKGKNILIEYYKKIIGEKS